MTTRQIIRRIFSLKIENTCRSLSPVREILALGIVSILSLGLNSTAFAKASKSSMAVTAAPPSVPAEAVLATAPGAAPASSASCTGCHGASGLSANELWPNLAGQKRDYLAKQLRAFRGGERTDPMMSAIAQTLTESDVDELARYFSSLKCVL